MKNIVIVGGGTAGWMAANLFINKWADKGVSVTLVESPEVGIIGVGEGSTPTLKRFFEMINVTESDWMSRCNATYKTNIVFSGWSPKSGISAYSHPFPTQVDNFTTRAFMVNCRTRRLGLDTNVCPENFLLNGVLARQGKGPKTPENFPFKIEYGYHFDSHLLGEFLAELAIKRGVKHIKAHVAQVVLADNGDISSLHTRQGEQIFGDLYIDCTGFAGILMKKTLGIKFTSFKRNLFNDSAIVMPSPISTNIPSQTVSTALSAGWAWKIPLQNRFGNGYVYSSDFISDEQAELEFRKHLGMLDEQHECRKLSMAVGQLEQHWAHNCLALGLSQGFIEPLEATALHLVQISIEFFMDQYEAGEFSAKHRETYNQKMSERFERVRDYIVAHYKLNTRDDSEYWQANRENQHLSTALLQLLDVWFQRKDLAQEIERQQLDTHFDAVSWHCLLAGYGAFPPLAENQPGKGCLYQDQQVEKFMAGCALNFSSHTKNLFV